MKKPRSKSKISGRRKLGGSVCLRIIKCAVAGCVLSIILVLMLALLLKLNLLPESSIAIITSVIKAICSAMVGLLCANGIQKRAWLIAGIGGTTYILLAFASFCAVERVMSFNLGFVADLFMGFIAGVAGSLLLINTKSS